MKKRLEADLISIAHRILQIKNKSDVNQLYLETQKLYEKLSILRFVEEHFGEAKPTIGQAEIVEKMKRFFEDNHLSGIKARKAQDEIVVDEIIAEEIVVDEIAEIAEEDVADIELEEEATEEAVPEAEIASEEKQEISDQEIPEAIVLKEEVLANEATEEEIEEVAETELEEITTREPIELKGTGFLPAFELDDEAEEEVETPNKMEEVQISFLDLLGGDYRDTFFEKVDQIENATTEITVEIPTAIELEEKATEPIADAKKENEEHKAVSLNDKLAKGINIDLNDRIAFVKHLFGNSNEDYNRVLSQLITFNSFYETRDFIDEMVKPDYNNWEGKDDYAERFMEIIEKKFL